MLFMNTCPILLKPGYADCTINKHGPTARTYSTDSSPWKQPYINVYIIYSSFPYLFIVESHETVLESNTTQTSAIETLHD